MAILEAVFLSLKPVFTVVHGTHAYIMFTLSIWFILTTIVASHGIKDVSGVPHVESRYMRIIGFSFYKEVYRSEHTFDITRTSTSMSTSILFCMEAMVQVTEKTQLAQ